MSRPNKTLTHARLARSMTMEQLARAAKISRQTLHRIEHGTIVTPRAATRHTIVAALNGGTTPAGYTEDDVFPNCTTPSRGPSGDRKEPPHTYPNRVRIEREQRGLKAVDLILLTGLSHSAMTSIETGRIIPSAEQIEAICEALSSDPEWPTCEPTDLIPPIMRRGER